MSPRSKVYKRYLKEQGIKKVPKGPRYPKYLKIQKGT